MSRPIPECLALPPVAQELRGGWVAGLCAVATALPLAAAAAPPSPDDYFAARGEGTWSSTELVGVTVYGADGEELGPVVDVLVGDPDVVVFEIGGFLGSGEKQIALPLRLFRVTAEPTDAADREDAAGTRLPPANNRDQAPIGGDPGTSLAPIYLSLDVDAEGLAEAPPYSADPRRIPAIAP
jgi:hypothetical protein